MAPTKKVFNIPTAALHPSSTTTTCSVPGACNRVNHSKQDGFDLKALIESIHKVLGDDKGLDSESIDAQQIIQLMEKYSSNSEDWSQYTLFDHSRAYTRNLIDDGNGKFNLMILAWSKGQQSPIHDHAGSHCVMKILDGELQETLFNWPEEATAATAASAAVHEASVASTAIAVTANDITEAVHSTCHPADDKDVFVDKKQALKVFKNTIYKPNQVTYVHDKIGLHRISNPNPERGAVSLHLYTPPYKVCKTFEETTGKARSSGICTFYSIGGSRI
ncbi:RmlC-like cupin domain-containing protein [Mycotypha africana]|uniref:RmlC-like cupin domain-containing protein n=1 Tax=Mycotypha africana TaxID=64632 RepID=UPI0022FFEEDA|nr:RmlC-like cupin domain-containing protein [Mycotypha africana]KAI8971913.1 RmlC-like cupin domain-containing protein [Mycotypha africana]